MSFLPAPSKPKQLSFVFSSEKNPSPRFSLIFFRFDITLLSGNCVQLFHMFSFSLNMAKLWLDSQSLFSKSQAAVHRPLLHLWNPFHPSTKHQALQFNYWAKNRSLAWQLGQESFPARHSTSLHSWKCLGVASSFSNSVFKFISAFSIASPLFHFMEQICCSSSVPVTKFTLELTLDVSFTLGSLLRSENSWVLF